MSRRPPPRFENLRTLVTPARRRAFPTMRQGPFLHRVSYSFPDKTHMAPGGWHETDSAPGVSARHVKGGDSNRLGGPLWLYPCVQGDLGRLVERLRP